MDNRFIDVVINEMKPFLDEQGFKASEDYTFENGKKKIRIEYVDEKQIYRLLGADINEDGSTAELTELTSWLFDDTQNKNDAVSVGIDFTDTLRKALGVKVARTSNSATDIDLPKNEKSDVLTVNGLTQKLLAIYPEFKDTYKQSVADNGKFLYLLFYRENFIPRINQTLTEKPAQKKQIKKLFDSLTGCFIDGDKETTSLIIGVICAACDGNEEALNTALEALGENSYLTPHIKNFNREIKTNKKLHAALIK